MDNVFNGYNKSNKTCLKHRRSHSIGFPVDVDKAFWNRIRADNKMENIFPNTIQIEKSSSPISLKSITLYSPRKQHSVRRSIDFKERDQKIMTPILYTFEQCCNHEEDKCLKIKLNTLKALQESDERRLISLTSENKDMKKKLENLFFENVKKENELDILNKMNKSLEGQINLFLSKYKTMQMLYKQNTRKVNNIKRTTEIIKEIEISVSDNYKLLKDITQLKNDSDIAKQQYESFRCNINENLDIILAKTKNLKEYCKIGNEYMNSLKNELCDINMELNAYSLENENLKLRYYELNTKLLNKTSHNEKKMSTVLLNIFLHFLFY